MGIHKKLAEIQAELKAPKNQYNSFGKYKYRSCEDILEAAKPLAITKGAVINISDDIIEIGGRVYVKATVTVTDIEDGSNITVSAMAREAADKKGMDDAQITGAASSYARKYALGGMFCLDDTKDADATNDGSEIKSPGKGKSKAQEVIDKAQDAGIAEPAKEYKCCDCGAPFKGCKSNGKEYSAGQIYHIAANNNTDGKPRCGTCTDKAGTRKQKG